MSFDPQSNINPLIHPGNYEEIFVLYIDGELSEADMQRVDAFILQHPEFRNEFDLLVNTRLPQEKLEMDKEGLRAEAMKMNVVDEEIFLLLDDELNANEARVVKKKLAVSSDLQMQFGLLQRAKLSPDDTIVFANKEILYRNEETRRIGFPWMRIAAAVLILAAIATAYLTTKHSESAALPQPGMAVQLPPVKADPAPDTHEVSGTPAHEISEARQRNAAAMNTKPKTVVDADPSMPPVPDDIRKHITEDRMAVNDILSSADDRRLIKTTLIEAQQFNLRDDDRAGQTASQIVNIKPVTSFVAARTTTVTAPEINHDEHATASNKGSVKGFLRKATKLIEKRTGIDPTNDGELLIAAVAINLK